MDIPLTGFKMKTRILAVAGLFAFVAALAPAPAHAQADILLQLRSGTTLGNRFVVDSGGGFVAHGNITYGIIPASGAGTRLMWHPNKVAFRAGYADAGGQFDESNIGYYSWAGGALSKAPGNYAFAMGNQNNAEAQCGVAIGSGNSVFGNASDGFGTCGVALGLNNKVRDQAGIALGHGTSSDGDAAIAIGYYVTADADYSMALGHRASTNGHTGARVFGDASTSDSIEAVANNEFAVRAAGGFRFRSNATLTNGCNIAAGGASITCASSYTLKNGFLEVDGEDILRKIRGLRIERWRYNDEKDQPWHLGPYSEDFMAAFKLGNDDKAIGHLDEIGVTMKGVQALDLRTLKQSDRIEKLEKENAELKKQNADLEARLTRLETLLKQ